MASGRVSGSLRGLLIVLIPLLFLGAMAWHQEASAAQLLLTWTDNSGNEDGFKVERKTGLAGYAQVATVAANDPSFIDPNLVAGTTYCYRVRAFNAGGDSAYSNEACGIATTLDRGRFVTLLYADVLGRDPDAAGLTGWVNFLSAHCNAGGFSTTVQSFFDSDEFRTVRPVTMSRLVAMIYQTMLSREPDPGGLAGWTGLLRQARLTMALQGFIPSPEFQGLALALCR